MDEPSRLSKAFFLPAGCRKGQAVQGGHSSAAESVAQTMKEIGWSSSKKWWSSPIFLCVSRDVWAWSSEPWQRECGCGAEGLEQSQQRWGGLVAVARRGPRCPRTAVVVLEDTKGGEGSLCPLPKPRAYLCPGEDESVPGLCCAGAPCPAHPALFLSPRKHPLHQKLAARAHGCFPPLTQEISSCF